MTLALLLVAGVALVALAGLALVSTRSAAGRELEHDLALGAEREPWAVAARLRAEPAERDDLPAGIRAA